VLRWHSPAPRACAAAASARSRGGLAGSDERRVARPEEAAELATFLASERAAYITGQGINVNGGMMLNCASEAL
jgi:NAD(P)-dependent dehydrogenase (short-subunit alcohol dehydrogenase family)